MNHPSSHKDPSDHIDSLSLPTTYNPKDTETKWYQFWEKSRLFKPSLDPDQPSFCVVIPPPNVTGTLHMGHVLPNTLQDVIVRYKRMMGFNTLWVPGTDHAGIATQTVVERMLIKEKGKRRKDFSREEFLDHVWAWKDKHENIILNQLKSLGCSCDWNHTRFTMDEGCCLAVRSVFKKMFDEGLIYRGDYLVNWDPVTQTALADDEVEHEEKQGFLWHFSYPIKDSQEIITVATTRPETMLGDTAVAVHPEDERYRHLIGKQVILPLTHREIPIIAHRNVDPTFGTGAVKITPAHDPNDYQMGLECHLPMINIMTPDGKINENGGIFSGLSMEEARYKVVDAMKSLSLCTKIQPHVHRVGHSYRSKAVIEPYLSKQWFVNMKAFAPQLRALVENKEVELIPKSWETTYFHWIDNLRDWCISRQLWWGHRIPIWYHKDDPKRMICHAEEGLPPEVATNPELWYQDEDVLDTWFSSAMWPFSTLGWPEKTIHLEQFYPNSVLITGHDILFFWVARMIMMGHYVMKKPPFPKTFLHGLIYGKSYWRVLPEGGVQYLSQEERLDYDLGKKPVPKDVFSRFEKMSKSKGNVINPLEIIDHYGTDAMRMGICVSAPQSREIDLDRRKFEDFKHFTNKIWNGARFVLMNLTASQNGEALSLKSLEEGLNPQLLTLDDHWLLDQLNQTTKTVSQALENYSFDKAATCAYDFFWKEFCAYYVEIAKPTLFGKALTQEHRTNKQKVLVIALLQSLRLLHPFIPFITEELFQRIKSYFNCKQLSSNQDVWTQDALKTLNAPACMVAPFPKELPSFVAPDQTASEFDFIQNVVYTIRNIRGEMKIPTASHVDLFFEGPTKTIEKVQQHIVIITALVKIGSIAFKLPQQLPFSSQGKVEDLLVLIPLPEELKTQEKQRLTKEKVVVEDQMVKHKAQLDNHDFIIRAPAHLVEQKKAIVNDLESQLKTIEKKLRELT